MLNQSNKSRLAIVDVDRCKPHKCNQECVMKCPPNHSGKKCIVVDIEDLGEESRNKQAKAIIANNLCIGCGICVKVCPFNAITVVNLPKELTDDKQLVSYGTNCFRVYMIPQIKKGSCMGIIGSNGLGKSTIIKILAGELSVDLIDKKKLLSGSELYTYLSQLKSKSVSYKPQDISIYNRKFSLHSVKSLLTKITEEIRTVMSLDKLQDRTVGQLSGGETQRLLISLACSKNADAYLFDEPTAFLDIKQRILAGNLIQSRTNSSSYVVLIEHDLCILDYVSDYVSCLYGEKGAFGVVSSPSGTFNGINNYLDGYLPAENVKFRDKPIKFRISNPDDELSVKTEFAYGSLNFSYSNTSFNLRIEEGSFSAGEVVLLLGENGTGKTTMIKLLAGQIGADFNRPELSVSIKEQEVYVSDSDCTVHDYIYKKIGNMLYNQEFKNGVINQLAVDKLFDLSIQNLSGGQMQRVAISVCLGTPADLYLLDEPTAYIDIEDRLVISKILRHYAMFYKKSVFLVEHDIIVATNTCDKVIVFTGDPSVECVATSPTDLKTGINNFMTVLNVTMRRDGRESQKTNGSGRPRINKKDSVLDKEQKKSGAYFID